MIAANEVLTLALNLPTQQRAEIAERLLESLPDEKGWPMNFDEDLKREIAQRIENRRLGKSKVIDFETFKKSVREAAKSSST